MLLAATTSTLVVLLVGLWTFRALHQDRPRHEHVVGWSGYEVTSPSTIVFSTWTGTTSCYYVRHVAQEGPGTLRVALIEGTRPDAPRHCTQEAVEQKVTVRTEAPAEELTVSQLPEDEVDLRP